MEKSEFSETQFVLGYVRELFNSISTPYRILAPSTKTEKQTASDLIIKKYNSLGKYRYSEFYQFKRSKYFNSETFGDLGGTATIDTSSTPMYGFNIYNSSKTEQFNVLQKISRQRKARVYYCAPNFHTVNEFNAYFSSGTVLANSKVILFNAKNLQKITIPKDSNHTILFDSSKCYVCSNPSEIVGLNASERNSFFENEFFDENEKIDEIMYGLSSIIKDCLENKETKTDLSDIDINFFTIKELLEKHFNIYWIPIYEQLK